MINRHYIEAAIALGAEINVTYSGGSQPGAARHIRPRSMTKGLVRAESEGQLKSFRVDLLDMPSTTTDTGHQYRGIQDLLMREQRLILASGFAPVADRFHLVLHGTAGPALSLGCSHGVWAVNGRRCGSFQNAAEVFLAALQLLTYPAR